MEERGLMWIRIDWHSRSQHTHLDQDNDSSPPYTFFHLLFIIPRFLDHFSQFADTN